MSNEYLKSLVDTVSGIEAKSEAEQIAKYELIEHTNQLQNNWNELKNSLKNEIERTNEIIAEDGDMVMMNNIRKMLNDDREVWLFKMQELENRKV